MLLAQLVSLLTLQWDSEVGTGDQRPGVRSQSKVEQDIWREADAVIEKPA